MHPLLRGRPIERIAVLRALMLGDMLCAVPALRALRAAFPAAAITWIGLEATRAMAARLDHLVDDFIALPGYPGLPEVPLDADALPGFFATARARRFDLALQMHGSGGIVNPLVASLGAHRTAGFFEPGAEPDPAEAPLYRAWPRHGSEIERLLALTDHLGLPRAGSRLEFPIGQADRDALAAAWRPEPDTPYVCLHAGAQLPSRRWAAERFAAVADAIADSGRTVVLTGAAGEVGLVDAVATRMRRPAVSLVGRTSLGALGALLEDADALVCNDTSVSHIAAALGCPSVVVSCGADAARWAPDDRALHDVLWAPMPCRPCAHRTCPYDHGCATAIGVDDVAAALARLQSPASAQRELAFGAAA